MTFCYSYADLDCISRKARATQVYFYYELVLLIAKTLRKDSNDYISHPPWTYSNDRLKEVDNTERRSPERVMPKSPNN